MHGMPMSPFVRAKLIQQSCDRKALIRQLRTVIRQDHKIVRQINRKYQTHQVLEQFRDNLKNRIQQLSMPGL